MNEERDPRYPYTHAADYIRGLGEYGAGGVHISRSEASQIQEGIALALGIAAEELAIRLADYAAANEQAISNRAMKKLMAASNIGVRA